MLSDDSYFSVNRSDYIQSLLDTYGCSTPLCGVRKRAAIVEISFNASLVLLYDRGELTVGEVCLVGR